MWSFITLGYSIHHVKSPFELLYRIRTTKGSFGGWRRWSDGGGYESYLVLRTNELRIRRKKVSSLECLSPSNQSWEGCLHADISIPTFITHSAWWPSYRIVSFVALPCLVINWSSAQTLLVFRVSSIGDLSVDACWRLNSFFSQHYHYVPLRAKRPFKRTNEEYRVLIRTCLGSVLELSWNSPAAVLQLSWSFVETFK